jgi:hypothetical protein
MFNHSNIRIPHSAFRTGKALFRYSFWDGWLGGARASRVQVRASRPNHRWTNQFVDGFSARRRKRQPGRSRSPFPNSALERLFSGIQFGMDDRAIGVLNHITRRVGFTVSVISRKNCI